MALWNLPLSGLGALREASRVRYDRLVVQSPRHEPLFRIAKAM
jgi:hypothetical protein